MLQFIAQFGFGRLQNTDWQTAYDRAIGLHRRAAQHSAAHVVSVLNAVLPADRSPWTAESLGNFAAFADPIREEDDKDGEVQIIALRPPTEIVALLLRGTDLKNDQQPVLVTMLLEKCNEVFDTLRHVRKYVREAEQQDPEFTDVKNTDEAHNSEASDFEK